MRIRITRLDASIPLPSYHSTDAAAFDLSAREPVVVPAGAVRLVPTGLVIDVPIDHALLVLARSSLPLKKRLMVANGIGLIDADYRGPDDEIKVEVYNFSDQPVRIERGERIAQGLFVKIARAQWEVAETASAPSRGGFGSTGGYEP